MNRYSKPSVCLAAFLLLIAAGFAPSPGQANTLSTAAAQELVKETSQHMLQVLGDKKQELERHPEQIYGLVKAILLPHFDFRRIARLALGRYWSQASKEQRQRFGHELRTLLVRTYSTALLKYSDEKIHYLPLRGPEQARRATVRMEIEQSRGGSPISLSVDLYAKGGAWKVYDISIEGVSLVTNYRTSFASEIRQGGLEQLIEKLEEKNKK